MHQELELKKINRCQSNCDSRIQSKHGQQNKNCILCTGFQIESKCLLFHDAVYVYCIPSFKLYRQQFPSYLELTL